MSYHARPVEKADESANSFGTGQQRPIVEEEGIALHDTPNSPHREHMNSPQAGSGRGGPVANAANDIAQDIAEAFTTPDDTAFKDDAANAFANAFRAVGRPPGDMEGFSTWVNSVTTETISNLRETGWTSGESSEERDAVYSAVIDHGQALTPQAVRYGARSR